MVGHLPGSYPRPSNRAALEPVPAGPAHAGTARRNCAPATARPRLRGIGRKGPARRSNRRRGFGSHDGIVAGWAALDSAVLVRRAAGQGDERPRAPSALAPTPPPRATAPSPSRWSEMHRRAGARARDVGNVHDGVLQSETESTGASRPPTRTFCPVFGKEDGVRVARSGARRAGARCAATASRRSRSACPARLSRSARGRSRLPSERGASRSTPGAPPGSRPYRSAPGQTALAPGALQARARCPRSRGPAPAAGPAVSRRISATTRPNAAQPLLDPGLRLLCRGTGGA